MSEPTIEEILAHDKEYQRLVKASEKAFEARAAQPPGSSRAKVTTANARWMAYAEARDRREKQLRGIE